MPKQKVGRLLLEWDSAGGATPEEWSSYQRQLQEILDRKNPEKFWRAQVENFGWRNLSGEKCFHARSSDAFLLNVLPHTDCRYRIYNYRGGIAIQNFHHDSPVGNEWYYIVPIAESTYEKQGAW
jgi:hypothetical protein